MSSSLTISTEPDYAEVPVLSLTKTRGHNAHTMSFSVYDLAYIVAALAEHAATGERVHIDLPGEDIDHKTRRAASARREAERLARLEADA